MHCFGAKQADLQLLSTNATFIRQSTLNILPLNNYKQSIDDGNYVLLHSNVFRLSRWFANGSLVRPIRIE